MAFISIRGVNHYFEWVTKEFGVYDSRPEHSQKPVLVFVHGWAGSTRYWRSTAQELTESFDCLLYDMRGFGRSRLPRSRSDNGHALGYQLESYAEDLAILLDSLHIQRVSINAHSTGASVAILFLNQHQERVESAILTCSGIFDYNRWTFSAFHKVGEYVVRFRPKWFLRVPLLDRFFMIRFLHRQISAPLYREFLEDFIEADFDAALGTIYTAVSEKAALEMPMALQTIQTPTLLISGEFDQIIPVKLGKKAAALNPCIEHVILPKTGHFPMLEDPDAYLSTVKRFLKIESPALSSVSLPPRK